MPRGSKILGTPINEEKWDSAKKRAAEEGQEGNYAYVMDIYKKMMHLGEFTEGNIAERKKKKMKVPAWRKKTKYSPKQYQTVAEKSSIDSGADSGYHEDSDIRLILPLEKSQLDEFRCGNCDTLLLRGVRLQKSFLEVKCRKCGTLNVN